MKTKYEYDVVEKETGYTLEKADSREIARWLKQDWKFQGHDVKIVQRKYKLESVKEVR